MNDTAYDKLKLTKIIDENRRMKCKVEGPSKLPSAYNYCRKIAYREMRKLLNIMFRRM